MKSADEVVSPRLERAPERQGEGVGSEGRGIEPGIHELTLRRQRRACRSPPGRYEVREQRQVRRPIEGDGVWTRHTEDDHVASVRGNLRGVERVAKVSTRKVKNGADLDMPGLRRGECR